MIIDREFFWSHIRVSLFRNQLNQSQVDGTNFILDGYEKEKGIESQLAYILATTFHETDATMRPIEEYGKGYGKPYGKPVNGHAYYGRGYVQLTWDYNYKKMSSVVGIDLFANPERALEPPIASKIMFYGMENGSFTGKKLSDYIVNNTVYDFYNSRKVINGLDKAQSIALYAHEFLTGIRQKLA